MPGFQHVFRAGAGIRRVVLIVPVHGDNALSLRAVCQEPGKGGFEGRALAPVDLVGQQGNFRMGRSRIRKVVEIFRFTAVIDKDNVPESVLQQSVNDRSQLFIRIQRGQHNGNVHQIFHFSTSSI